MTLTPYPRLGECVRALAGALDSKTGNRDVDRLAREGDFDWSRLDGVVQELLIEGTTRLLPPRSRQELESWLYSTRSAYCGVVLETALDSIDRELALPVLIEEFFAPRAVQLLLHLDQACEGPGLARLVCATGSPVTETLDWLDAMLGEPIDKMLHPDSTGESKSARDKIGKWRSGVDLPSALSLKLLTDSLRSHPKGQACADAASVWLLVARALTYLDQLGAGRLLPQLQRCLLQGAADGPVSQRLLEIVKEAGRSWPDLAHSGQRLWLDLRRTTPKLVGDQASTWQRLLELEQLSAELDPSAKTAYQIAWMKGRWHALSGEYEDAVVHYQVAFEMACYRAGHQVKEILEDALCIAAFMGKRVFVRQMKHVGVALGLFTRPSIDAPVEDWEMDQLSQQLFLRFPPQGRFLEAAPDLATSPLPGLMLLTEQEVDRFKLDVQKPDRVRAVRFADGSTRKWPQLRLFASFGRTSQVEALLDAGGNVNVLDSSGGSALLCAIQYAQSTGDRGALDLLLDRKHEATTLNASTTRKKLTPIICAIDLGAPDVVQKLLEAGASAEQVALTDAQSPLYHAVTLLNGRSNPHRMLEQLLTRFAEAPDEVTQDTLRRFGVAATGPFGADTSLIRAEPVLGITVAKAMVEQHVRRHSPDRLQCIIELLLRHGADPNRAHKYPAPGRTPLMLAAEGDLPLAFEAMVEYRGDPLRPDGSGHNCVHIAAMSRSHRITALMRPRQH